MQVQLMDHMYRWSQLHSPVSVNWKTQHQFWAFQHCRNIWKILTYQVKPPISGKSAHWQTCVPCSFYHRRGNAHVAVIVKGQKAGSPPWPCPGNAIVIWNGTKPGELQHTEQLGRHLGRNRGWEKTHAQGKRWGSWVVQQEMHIQRAVGRRPWYRCWTFEWECRGASGWGPQGRPGVPLRLAGISSPIRPMWPSLGSVPQHMLFLLSEIPTGSPPPSGIDPNSISPLRPPLTILPKISAPTLYVSLPAPLPPSLQQWSLSNILYSVLNFLFFGLIPKPECKLLEGKDS